MLRVDDAEQALLGACLINPQVVSRVAETVRKEDFFFDVYREIFEAMLTLVATGRTISPMTVAPFIEAHQHFIRENTNPARLLASIAAAASTMINARHYAVMIADAARRREAIELVDGYKVILTTVAEESVATLIEQLDASLLDIRQRAPSRNQVSFEISESSETVLREAERAFLSEDDAPVGMRTTLPSIDRILEGFDPGSLVLIGARPSMGKTALALTFAVGWARAGKIVPFFSLEMTATQLALRALSAVSGIPGMDIRSGNLTPADFATLLDRQREFESWTLPIEQQPSATLATLRSRCSTLATRHGDLSGIIVDYLQLMTASDVSRRQGRNAEITEISAGLKALAREFGCPVFALSQLSRALEQRSDGRPQLSDLRDSGTLEQDADVVIFVYRHEQFLRSHRPKPDAPIADQNAWDDSIDDAKGLAELIVGKHRQGPLGVAHVRFNPETTLFFDPPKGADI